MRNDKRQSDPVIFSLIFILSVIQLYAILRRLSHSTGITRAHYNLRSCVKGVHARRTFWPSSDDRLFLLSVYEDPAGDIPLFFPTGNRGSWSLREITTCIIYGIQSAHIVLSFLLASPSPLLSHFPLPSFTSIPCVDVSEKDARKERTERREGRKEEPLRDFSTKLAGAKVG